MGKFATDADPNAVLAASKKMDEVQTRCFQMYVALGPTRSLPTLFNLTQERKIGVTERQLKRWSVQWRWSDLATLTQQELAKGVADEVMPTLKAELAADMESIRILKDRFHKRVAIDPFDEIAFAQLSDDMKKLAIIPDLADYERLLKLEHGVLGGGTENVDGTNKVTMEFSDDVMLKLLGERARQQYGLPPPPKDVTPRE
jgi:hypothetical protein